MNLHLPFSRARDTAALAALRDETIVLRTQVTFLEEKVADLQDNAVLRRPYRAEKVRMIDSRSPKYKSARANVIEQLKQAVERGV